MPDYTLTYCRRATGTEEVLGIFHSAAHAKTHAEAWALNHLGPICEWQEHEQENGEVWFETEEKHSQIIPRGRGLHRFLVQPIQSTDADLTSEEDLLANEEPGNFFV